MRSGQFRHRVTIQAPTETKSATGAMSVTYADATSRWADVLPVRSREYEQFHLRFAEMEAVYKIRGYYALTLKHRLVHDGQTMDIIGVQTDGNRSPANAPIITVVCKGRR